MTRKTVAQLQARLSTGDSSDDSITAGMVRDLSDSYLDLDTYEANLAGTSGTSLNKEQVLFTLTAANMNATTDQSLTGAQGGAATCNFVVIGIPLTAS